MAFGTASITASAFGLTGDTQPVQVTATLSGPLSQSIQRGTSLNLMLSLPSAVPAPVTLAVRSDNPTVASVPATATIVAGTTGAVIPVSGVAAGTTLVHAGAAPDIPDFAVTITVFTAGTISLQPVSVTLGQSLPFPVTLIDPAPAGGLTVQLASANPAIVQIAPATVFIAAGQIVPVTQPEIVGVNIGATNISASAPGYATATLQVPVTATITMSPQSLNIPVGGSQVLSMLLSAAAPSIGVPVTPDRAAGGYVEGLTVQLSSSNPSVASVQPSVNFYSDGSSITTVVVVINGVGAGTAVIHAGAPPFIPDAIATITVGSSSGGVSTLVASGGTPQTAQINTPFGLPLSVTALDAGNHPVPGVTVTFLAPTSGPSATFAGGATTAITDASGVARSQTLTANGLAGTYQVAATAAGVATPTVFTLTNQQTSSGTLNLSGPATISPSQSLPFPVNLSTPAPASGVTVSFSSSDSSKIAISPPSVAIGAGATTPVVQPTITGGNFGSATVGASAPGYTSASKLVQVGATLTFSPTSLTVAPGSNQNVTLNLSSPAPPSGLTVTLSSNSPTVASIVPSAVFQPSATSTTAAVTGLSSGQVTITAATGLPSVPDATATVTVSSGTSITLASGVKLSPGEFASIPISLSSPAGPGGVSVTLASSDNTILTVNPLNIYFPEGQTSPFAQPQVNGRNLGSATVSATALGLTGASALVQVVGRLSGPPSQTLQRGSAADIAFVLSWPTSTALTLNVSSDNPGVAGAPATVTIPANGTMALVHVTANAAGSTVLHVSAPNIPEATTTILVQSPGTLTLASGVSVALGQSAPIAVQIGSPAPAGGLVVALATSDTNTVSIFPTSVVIPAGATTPAAQPVVTGNGIGAANIMASAPGYLSATQQVAVTATITMSPTVIDMNAGETRLLAMILSGAAPSSGPITPDRGSGGFVNGLTVQLTSSNPNVAWVQPSVQFYPDGSSVTTVIVVINGQSPGTATIHASALPFIPDVFTTVNVH
jgi:hypothetical protein